MQIPKQPRTKSPAPEVSQPESQPAGNQGSAPPAAEDLNKQLQQAYSSYLENINSANLHAQLEHAKAYLAYLETLQQHQTRSGSDPALEYWKEILQAHDNAQASADAHKKFAMAQRRTAGSLPKDSHRRRHGLFAKRARDLGQAAERCRTACQGDGGFAQGRVGEGRCQHRQPFPRCPCSIKASERWVLHKSARRPRSFDGERERGLWR